MSAKKISELLDVFLEVRTDLGDGTRQLYRRAIGRLPETAVDAIDVLEGQRIAAGLFKRTVRDHAAAAATVNIDLRCIKAFFNWLVTVRAIGENPFLTVKSRRDTHCGKPFYEDAQIGSILRACPDKRWRLIVTLAATAAMRRSEILNLTVGEVDYLAGVITLSPKQRTAATWNWQLKDHESRQVPITDLCEKCLLEVHAELPDGQPYVCLPPAVYQRRIRQARKGTLGYELRKCPVNNFTRDFRAICRLARVDYRSFHSLRGTCLTAMAENGLQPHELAQIAGHSDVRTTYSHYIRPRKQILQNARQKAPTWAV
jgi:integrase